MRLVIVLIILFLSLGCEDRSQLISHIELVELKQQEKLRENIATIEEIENYLKTSDEIDVLNAFSYSNRNRTLSKQKYGNTYALMSEKLLDLELTQALFDKDVNKVIFNFVDDYKEDNAGNYTSRLTILIFRYDLQLVKKLTEFDPIVKKAFARTKTLNGGWSMVTIYQEVIVN